MAGQPTTQDFDGWMRKMEKRATHLERRRNISQASDILGPGFDSTSAQIEDWNSDTAAFNGWYWGPPGTFNSPDITLYWITQTITSDLISGVQHAYQFSDPGSLGEFQRRFRDDGAGNRVYEPWVSVPSDTGYLNTVITPQNLVSIPQQYVRKTGNTISVYMQFILGAALTVDTRGNISDTTVGLLGPGFGSSAPYPQALSGGASAGVFAGCVSGSSIILTATAPGVTLPSGSTIRLSGVIHD